MVISPDHRDTSCPSYIIDERHQQPWTHPYTCFILTATTIDTPEQVHHATSTQPDNLKRFRYKPGLNTIPHQRCCQFALSIAPVVYYTPSFHTSISTRHYSRANNYLLLHAEDRAMNWNSETDVLDYLFRRPTTQRPAILHLHQFALNLEHGGLDATSTVPGKASLSCRYVTYIWSVSDSSQILK